MNVSRSQYRRLLELHSLLKTRKYPNCTRLAKRWEVSRKTVQRDINFMKYEENAPIEYDPVQRGYYYTDAVWEMPAFHLTGGEFLQLLLAERMAAQFTGTPLADTLESLFTKIRNVLADKMPVDPAFFKRQFSFHGRPARPIDPKVWRKLFRALNEDRVIKIVYKAARYDRPATLTVEPVHLTCIADEWYLIAYRRDIKGYRHYAVSRIRAVEVTREEFFRDFNPGEYLSHRFGRYIGSPDDMKKIVIRFSKEAAPWVMERRWHEKQKVRKHRDGTLTLTFPAPALYEVKRWVLQWGKEAEVLEPEELRRDVAAEAAATAGVYRKTRAK